MCIRDRSDDGKYLVMGNGSRSFAIRNEEVQEHITPEKMTVLVAVSYTHLDVYKRQDDDRCDGAALPLLM